jgi:hypothetical protein
VCGESSIFGDGRHGRLTELASEQSRRAHFLANGDSEGDPPVKKPSKLNFKGQGWLFSGYHWNFDVISNSKVAENCLAGPVPFARVGKNMFLERKAHGNHVCRSESSFVKE